MIFLVLLLFVDFKRVAVRTRHSPLITRHCMTDRWEEINRLYNAACGGGGKRAARLSCEKACQGDEELRREVESLLAYDQQAQQLLDRPAMQMAAEKLAGEPPSLVGRKLGPYQIQVALGAGGMGEVYRARDTRLNRTVAIKVLPRHLSERPDLRQRFEREARAIANLNHPQICALYDIGREDGIDFLVMEYLEGETLSKRLKKGPLTDRTALAHGDRNRYWSGPGTSTGRDSSGSEAGKHHADEGGSQAPGFWSWRSRRVERALRARLIERAGRAASHVHRKREPDRRRHDSGHAGIHGAGASRGKRG